LDRTALSPTLKIFPQAVQLLSIVLMCFLFINIVNKFSTTILFSSENKFNFPHKNSKLFLAYFPFGMYFDQMS
jgi:hypothetical protein